MAIENEIRARLVADATVGGLVATRVYPLLLPEPPTYPAIVYRMEDEEGLHNLAGAVPRTTPTIMMLCYATTYMGALALAAAVRDSLDGFNGLLTTLKAVIKIKDETDDYDDAVQKYCVNQSYAVSCNES